MKSSERLLEVLKYTKKSMNSLGKELGHGNGVTIGYIVNERNGISAKVAAAICDNYSEISYDWIMNNKGEMLLEKLESNNGKRFQNTNLIKTIKDQNVRIEIVEQHVR
ncbi:hypothetical protein N9P53_05180 [Flavobacteriaceae bacterium]|nr:hypothetical protein [Flavobacteriaceae bacterium]|tara:strand:+ start:277 stop:600 length:324 start_codon:yes stop_codon:yes gene_type:complete